MTESISNLIAPKNILRIGINMSNFLLVNKDSTFSKPEGLSPEIGKLLARELDLDYEFVTFKNPGLLADAVDYDKWDVGNFAYEKKRAEVIDFSNPYVNIDANFLLNKNSEINQNKDVDNEINKIAVVDRSAYDLWLSGNFKRAKIIRAKTIIETHNLFYNQDVNILAGLKPKLLEELNNNDQFKLIDTPFTFIKQSIGIKKGNSKVINFINNFVSKKIKDGTIKSLLKKYNLEDKLSIPV
ncbi:transporter substrate-binding domain-containing protein [Candidatus Pelagibacter sp. HIMB1695]|uniref:transporter substrate-binding domain-containing protein n=1 Tax=Candidatus Pelagibacter sp. HIMB1695 TaxID=3413364 RepID=UPI003F8493C2